MESGYRVMPLLSKKTCEELAAYLAYCDTTDAQTDDAEFKLDTAPKTIEAVCRACGNHVAVSYIELYRHHLLLCPFSVLEC